MASAVANRYASAFLDAVLSPGSGVEPHEAAEQLQRFESLIRESPELRNVIISPAVSTGKKRAVFGRLAEMLSLSRLVRNFLFVLLDHRRGDILGDVARAFEAVLDERLGVVRAQVTSAAPLSDDGKQELEEQLSRVTAKRVRCEYSVDPELIGGVVARIGSTVYDGSVRSELQRLRERLVAA